ncbi:MAG: type IX secretion system protein PorQ [Paludibacter sp.]|nr:type IX secretion system protein PorQ [Paludibacter sp.]
MAKKIILLLLLVSGLQAFSQAGYGVYQFLDLPVSSRLAALGGTNVSLRDNDLNFALVNPALLTAETDKTVGLSVANYLSDIQFGSAVYGHNVKDVGYFGVGIQYIDYGKFQEATDLNELTGQTFTAKDFALHIMYARPLNKYFTVGATLKPVYSVYERYTSYGVALDGGVSYNDPKSLFSAGLVFKNLGTQFKGYYSDEDGQHYEPLPFNLQLGITQKLAHAPLRFSMTLHNLQHWDLSYESTNQPVSTISTSETTTTEATKSISFVDMAFRHTIFAVEFVPTKSFYLAASYDHRRHSEMKMTGFKSMAGFSFGGGVKLYKFQVGFGTTIFQTGVSSYQFSISTALNDFRL